jgi:hypothetical protein
VGTFWRVQRILLNNGTILKSTLEEKLILKIIPLLQIIMKELAIHQILSKQPWAFYRVTENIFVIVATRTREPVLQRMFDQFTLVYEEKLKARYQILPKSLDDLMSFSIFSTARQAGPEPIAWDTVKNASVTEEMIWKYSMSGMMVLMNEVKGAVSRVLNFHPLITENKLMMIYLFQIPMPNARGGAFDSAIITMVNYEDRAILYKFHSQIEHIFSLTADDLTQEFQNQLSNDIQGPLKNRNAFHSLVKTLSGRFKAIPLTDLSDKKENLKNEMLDSIKQLTKLI